MTSNSYSVFNAMVDIVASPGKALDEIKLHTSWLWWPLLIVMLSTIGMMVYFFSWVDFPWLIEETIRTVPPENRAESADAIRSFMSPSTSTWTTVIAVVIMSFIVYLIGAIYLHLMNKLTTGADIGFGSWFSLSAWASFIGIFGVVAGFVAIFTSGSNQMAQQDLAVTSFNNLFVHASAGTPWFTWASTISLLNLWTIFLTGLGFSRWTESSMVKSMIIAALPWVLIFGIWAAMI